MVDKPAQKGDDPRFVNHRIRFPRELHDALRAYANENRWSFNAAMNVAAERLLGDRYDPSTVSDPVLSRGPRVGQPPVPEFSFFGGEGSSPKMAFTAFDDTADETPGYPEGKETLKLSDEDIDRIALRVASIVRAK